jgi:hypothetical protein
MAATHRSAQLSPMQERFVQEYLVDCNATAAYKRAGYKGQGNVAEVNAHRLLRSAKVAAAVQGAQEARAQRLQLTQDAVLAELMLLAHSDILDYIIDDHGDVTLRAGAPPQAMRAVASLKKKISHTDAGVCYETTITLWNKPVSVRMAGEHLGLFKGTEQALPDIHLHLGEARHRLADRLDHLAVRRLADRLDHLAVRHAEDATNGH